MNTILPPAADWLSKHGIPFQIFQHTHPVLNLAQAAQERGQDQDQVIRSIVFRLPQDQFIMVLVSGPCQISWKVLRKYLETSRITMATDEEVLAVTGAKPGAVSPFGLPKPLRILVDNGVLKQQMVSLGSGIRGTAIIMKTSDLTQALREFEAGNFVE
jgi:Cys-tRNA(Pro)/Cys-tRNA(Cys) deacylase